MEEAYTSTLYVLYACIPHHSFHLWIKHENKTDQYNIVKAKYVLNHSLIWQCVKTLYPCSSHQNSWDLWMFIPLNSWYFYRYWSIAKSTIQLLGIPQISSVVHRRIRDCRCLLAHIGNGRNPGGSCPQSEEPMGFNGGLMGSNGI